MPQNNSSYEFDAFISYRQTTTDRRLAERLQRALETYRVPRALVARGVPRKVGRIFRDSDELRSTGDLSQTLVDTLGKSRFLIVVCSRQTPESKWVSQEVETFQALGRHDRILPVLVEGEPSTSFPKPLLRNRERPGGGEPRPQREDSSEAFDELALPLAIDLRAPGLRGSLAKLKVERLRLLATMLNCQFSDLRRREQERFVRKMVAVTTTMAGAATVFAVLTVMFFVEKSLAVSNAQRADSNAHQAEENAKRAQINAQRADENALKARSEEKRAEVNQALALDSTVSMAGSFVLQESGEMRAASELLKLKRAKDSLEEILVDDPGNIKALDGLDLICLVLSDRQKALSIPAAEKNHHKSYDYNLKASAARLIQCKVPNGTPEADSNAHDLNYYKGLVDSDSERIRLRPDGPAEADARDYACQAAHYVTLLATVDPAAASDARAVLARGIEIYDQLARQRPLTETERAVASAMSDTLSRLKALPSAGGGLTRTP